MEASGTTPEAPPRAGANRLLDPVREAGDLVGFAGRAVAQAPATPRYFAEILRQCAILILGSTLVLVALTMVMGGVCESFVANLLRPLGAVAFSGQLQVPCGLREMYPYMFAYIFAAKVGCGFVAEIGSMRINDEIDALESVGIEPMRYIIATRLLAVWICVPLIYALALLSALAGAFLVAVVQFGDISAGQHLTGYWTTQSLEDNVYSLIKIFTMTTAISLVGMYYGYRAAGGPVGVGDSVARSMIVNLVLIHMIGAFWSAVFWGSSAGFPLGG